MPTKETPNTVNVVIGESNNNAPVAPTSFQRAWDRLSSVLSHRQHSTGEDEVERGEHQQKTKGTLHIAEGSHEEHAEAGATSLNEPPAAATKSQHHSPFSSTAFDQLPQPIPVVDIFFGSWWLILALRTATRLLDMYFSWYWLWTSIPFVSGSLVILAISAIYGLRWAVLLVGRDTIPILGVPIPGKRQLFWALFCLTQKFWVSPARASESEGLLTSSKGAHHRQIHTEEWQSMVQTIWGLVVCLYFDHAHGGIQTELHGSMAATQRALDPHLRRR